jgi:hypothetical protein
LLLLLPGVGGGAQEKTPQLAAPKPDIAFTLSVELVFKGRTVSGQIKRSEIEALLDLPVRNGLSEPEEGYGVELTSDKRERKKVLSCREWKKATAEGWYAFSTFDMAMEGFLIRTCELLFALKNAELPRKSFLSEPHVGVSNMELLPADVLTTQTNDSYKELVRKAKRGTTVAMLARTGEVVVHSQSPTEIHLTYEDDMDQLLREVGRADFNGDGIEDIMVFCAGRAVGGTMGFSDYIFLTRRKPEGRLELLKVKQR